MKKLTLLLALAYIIHATAFSQPCLPEGITFTTQAEIDSFQTNYPNCTEIEGDVKIGAWLGGDIDNLNGLNVIESIKGGLSIGYWFMGTATLQNLAGLENLTDIGGNLEIHANFALQNLTGLEKLTSIGGSIVIGNGDAKSTITGNRLNGNPCLKNLNGLENLETIGGGLFTQFNDSLISFKGLDKLDSIEGINTSDPIASLSAFSNLSYIGNEGLKIHNTTLTSFTGLENVTCIGGDVYIFKNDSLINLKGLENLTSINGDLIIGPYRLGSFGFGNLSLVSLTGLDNLVNVGGNLKINLNAALTNLTGLENLTSVAGGNLLIGGDTTYTGHGGNPSLISLEGLGNIDKNSITGLVISYNSLLSACDVESICDYLASPNGTIEIHDNTPGCNSQEEVEAACLNHCLPEGITFTTQAEIDSFQINYPDCDKIEGDVWVLGPGIINLDELSALTSINGSFEISYTYLSALSGLENLRSIGGQFLFFENDSISNLMGLHNVTAIGSDIVIVDNHSLTNLTGLENIDSINRDLKIGYGNYHIGGGGNPSLISFKGLGNLVAINGDLNIESNAKLTDLAGFDNLKTIKGSLSIGHYLYGNTSLTSLNGLDSLKTIGGNLNIEMNDALTSLSGLENLVNISGRLYVWSNKSLNNLSGISNTNFSSFSDLYIESNTSLSDCDVLSICNFLVVSTGYISIKDNAPGCNSGEEVWDSCVVSVEERYYDLKVFIHPNPFNKTTIIEYELEQPSKIQITIYNHLGKQIEIIEKNQSHGKQQIIWNAEGLPVGIYFCVLKTNQGTQTTKLIKLNN